jgi:hypothetical protein
MAVGPCALRSSGKRYGKLFLICGIVSASAYRSTGGATVPTNETGKKNAKNRKKKTSKNRMTKKKRKY